MVLFIFESFKRLDHGCCVFHWLNVDALVILLSFQSRIFSLNDSASDLVGSISRQVGFLAKFGLRSFSVMNASLLAVVSTFA